MLALCAFIIILYIIMVWNMHGLEGEHAINIAQGHHIPITLRAVSHQEHRLQLQKLADILRMHTSLKHFSSRMNR